MLVMWILCRLCRSLKRYAIYAPSRNSMLFMLPRWNYASFYASIIGRSLIICLSNPPILIGPVHNIPIPSTLSDQRNSSKATGVKSAIHHGHYGCPYNRRDFVPTGFGKDARVPGIDGGGLFKVWLSNVDMHETVKS